MPSLSPQKQNSKSAHQVGHEGLLRSAPFLRQISEYVDYRATDCPSNQRSSIKLVPIETVCDMLGLKRSATLGMVKKGILPPPIKFGASRRAAARWLEHEIFEYILKKAAERSPAVDSRIDQKDSK